MRFNFSTQNISRLNLSKQLFDLRINDVFGQKNYRNPINYKHLQYNLWYQGMLLQICPSQKEPHEDESLSLFSQPQFCIRKQVQAHFFTNLIEC